ncbi:MAG: hypothetical protein IJ881_00680 [Neisseriaceae bacterium]|nr:hypothetical protein [Neisseriaceae bacterium]
MAKIRDIKEIQAQLRDFEQQYDLIASSSNDKRTTEQEVLLAKIGALRWVLNDNKSYSAQRIWG